MLYTAFDETGRTYHFEVTGDNKHVFLTLRKEAFAQAKQLWLLPEIGHANAGDKGWFVMPRNIQMNGDFLVEFRPREDAFYNYDRPIMSLYCVKRPGLAALVRIERNYKYSFDLKVEQGVYTVMPKFDFTVEDQVYDDIRVEILFFEEDAGYGQMAQAERSLRLSRGEATSLQEKCRREAVEYARKYPLIRIRMGWKPVPSPIEHQTLENEPPMHVACTFEQVCQLADAMKERGVEGAEIQLVGWNVGGHDGRWPEMLPADERLGGTEGLKKAIQHVKQLGYRISLHTNTIDSYEIAHNFNWADLVQQRDGSHIYGGCWGGGMAHHVCAKKQLEYSHRDLPELAALGVNGLHYIDVLSILQPDACFSSEHPCNTTEAIMYTQRNMQYVSALFGGFSSEGCMDFAMRDMDYALYACFGNGFGDIDLPICDKILPFFELTYHGIVLYNPSSPTINYPIKSGADQLTFFMRGGRPSLYLYSKFRTGGAANWMGEIDLTLEDMDQTLDAIVRAAGDCKEMAARQLVYMIDYQCLANGLEIATYEDGVEIVGNFSEKEVEYKGEKIEAYGNCIL